MQAEEADDANQRSKRVRFAEVVDVKSVPVIEADVNAGDRQPRRTILPVEGGEGLAGKTQVGLPARTAVSYFNLKIPLHR